MLVASRDPFHGADHGSDLGPDVGADRAPMPGNGSRLTRAMGALQIMGTLLAIPVGLGSAYTMYKSNFSAEASCQSLRSNIILILDKSVDASARHMLVRRDVEAFEHSCGSVDPDAAAAFKALLATDKAAVATPVRRVEAPAKPVERRAEAKPEPKAAPKSEAKSDAKAEAKVEPAKPAEAKPSEAAKPAEAVKQVAVAAPAARDPETSDAAWLEAVRGALVNHAPEPVPAETVAAPAAEVRPVEAKTAEPKVALRPAVREPLPPLPQSTWTAPVATPVNATAAPALPPPASVASVPAPREQTAQVDDGHPVPPGAIPDPGPTDLTPETRSRIGALISHIPFANRLIER